MNILIPTDGSAAALRAAKFAAKLGEDVHITLMSVHDDAGLRHLKKYVARDSISDYLRCLSEKDLKATHDMLNKLGVSHDMIIKTGHVAEEILKIAKVEKYDLLVMGAKGRSVISDMLIGSVAQRVMTLTVLPITLVK